MRGSIPAVTTVYPGTLTISLFLAPNHEKEDNFPPPGLLTTLHVCAIKRWQYWLLYNGKQMFCQERYAFLEFIYI